MKLTSLRARLLLLVILVLAINGGMAAVLASRVITERFEQYVVYRQAASQERQKAFRASLPGLIIAHYGRRGGWDELAELLTPLGDMGEQRLLVTDATGTVVIDSTGVLAGQSLPRELARDQELLLTDDGQLIGALAVIPYAVEQDNSTEAAYIAQVNRALLWAVLGAGALAIVLTLAITGRSLQAVEALTRAARAMEQGDLQQRVAVRSRDEIGELAHAFNAMADTLARVEQLRRNMVGDVAHELRTPLANIRGYLEAVEDGVVQSSPDMIHLLYEEAMLLNQLVDDLQELALADAGQLKLNFQEVNLSDVVNHAAQSIRTAYHVHQADNGQEEGLPRLEVEMPQEMPKVWADPARVGQVLRNLLGNALTHTPPDGQIDVRIVVHQAELEVHVRNSGEPIPPEHLPYVFERFYRSDQSRNRTTGGSGLGLAIVKQLIDAHGGRVWVENLPGYGVCFGFSLRIHPPDRSS